MVVPAFGIESYQASRRISPYDDTDRAILAGYGGMAASVVIASAGIAYAWDKADTFFYRTYNWSTFKYMDSPFDTLRKSPVKNKLLLASKVHGYAMVAWAASNIAYAGYHGGWSAARQETYDQFYDATFGPLIWLGSSLNDLID